MFKKARFTPAKTSRIAALRLKGCKPLKNITDAILHYMPESSTSRRFDTIAAPRCDLKSRDLKSGHLKSGHLKSHGRKDGAQAPDASAAAWKRRAFPSTG